MKQSITSLGLKKLLIFSNRKVDSLLIQITDIYNISDSPQFHYINQSLIIQSYMNLFTKDINQLRELKKIKYNKTLKSINVEDILHRIQLHSVKTDLERVKISEEEFITLCVKVRELVLIQPGLLKLDGPIYVCSGTLGNYQQLANIIDKCHHPKFMSYLFLGDYTGRYQQSVECLVALFAYKLFMPNNFFLLRGIYQTIAMTKAYNLFDQLQYFFQSSLPWKQACQTLCSLPYAAIVDEKVLCVHGGISPYLQSIDQINRIPRPMDAADKELTCDLLWADPTNLYEGWTENDRGFGVSFGHDVLVSFLKANDLTLLCRSNGVAYQGFKFCFDKRLVTITSLSNYCDQTNNSSAVMKVDENSNILFKIISEKNNYTEDQEEGLTFMDMVKRKRQRQEKLQKKIEEKAARDLDKLNQKKNKAKNPKKIIKEILQ